MYLVQANSQFRIQAIRLNCWLVAVKAPGPPLTDQRFIVVGRRASDSTMDNINNSLSGVPGLNAKGERNGEDRNGNE